MYLNERGSTRNLGPWLCALVLLLPVVGGTAAHIRYGLGTPGLKDWCRLDWDAVCAYGVVARWNGGGLALHAAPTPPGTGFQISNTEIPGQQLLFVLESPQGGGWIKVSNGEGEWERISVPQAGHWWLVVEGLTPSETFRLELGPYTDVLAISGIYYRCELVSPLATLKWECMEKFLGGMVIGAIVTWLLLRAGQIR